MFDISVSFGDLVGGWAARDSLSPRTPGPAPSLSPNAEIPFVSKRIVRAPAPADSFSGRRSQDAKDRNQRPAVRRVRTAARTVFNQRQVTYVSWPEASYRGQGAYLFPVGFPECGGPLSSSRRSGCGSAGVPGTPS